MSGFGVDLTGNSLPGLEEHVVTDSHTESPSSGDRPAGSRSDGLSTKIAPAEDHKTPRSSDSRPAARGPRPGVVGLILSGLLIVLAVLALGWRLSGGHWEVVATPSMGQAAPVGSVVFTRPVTVDELRVGDIVSYRPPGTTGETITHRVVQIDADGVRTRGDINPATDPWHLHTGDLVGRVISIWWGIGWLIRSLPLLIVGSLVLWWATKWYAAPRWRVPSRILGFSLLVSIAAYLLRPFVGVVLLATTGDETGTHATLVSTGLLPIRITAATNGHVDLRDGSVGVLTTRLPTGSPGVSLTSHPHLSWWQWVVFILICCIPLLYALTAGYQPRDYPPVRPDVDERGPDDHDNADAATSSTSASVFPPQTDPGLYTHHPMRRGRRRWVAVALVVLGAVAVTGGGAPTSAALTASIANTTNTAGAAATFFTCRAATATIGAAATIFTYPLSDTPVTLNSNAVDLSGNTRKGVYSAGFTTTTSRPCTRDTTTTAVALAPTAVAPAFVSPAATTALTSLNVFTEAIWFKTTSASGGRLIGWGNSQTGTSSTYDRHIFLNNAGNVVFGVYVSGVKVVTSPKTYNDGAWHQAVATLSGAGMNLYLDGALVASDSGTTTAEGGTTNTGYWRVGYDNLAAWGTNTPLTYYFTGSLAWASVFSTALTGAQVSTLYTAGT